MNDVSPAAPPTLAAPDPATTERIAALERQVTRLRRDHDRMARVMALLEHDLAIERIAEAQPTVLDRLVAWFAEMAAWLSPHVRRPARR